MREATNSTTRNLPPGWRWARLRDIGPITDGDWILTNDYAPSGVRLLQVGDVGVGNFVGKSSRFITEKRAQELDCTLLEAGDILISRMPDPIGRACVLPTLQHPCITAVDVSIFRPDLTKADRDFLTFFFCSAEWFERVLSLASGATRPRISRSNLEQLGLPLPPLTEQKRIAAILNEQMAAVERARAAAQAQLAAAKALPVAYLRRVFPQPGQELPSGWRWVRLGDYTKKVGSGITPLGGQASYVTSGVPLIRSQNVHFNRFVKEGLVYISDAQDAEMDNSRVQEGDVLLNITGASIGRVCVVPAGLCQANVNQHVSIVRCVNDVHPEFLSYFISTPAFHSFILDSQAGATRQALTKALIEDFHIPLLPLAEQKRIAAILNEQVAAAEKLQAELEAQLNEVNAFPTSLLRRAFRGEI